MLPTAPTAAELDRTAVTVRVYQSAGLPFDLEQRALAEAEAVLASARLDVSWQTCPGKHAVTCKAPPSPSDLLVRLIRTGAPGQDTSATLGTALVDHAAGGGVLATVYVNRVARMANAAGTDPAVLLGRVTAHELGHLLMGAEGHSRLGLMRPRWTVAEIRRNRSADWRFTAADLAVMRRPASGS